MKFVKRICHDIKKEMIPKTRYSSVLLPIQRTAESKLTEIEKAAKPLIDPIFHQGGEPKKYAILCKVRSNSGVRRSHIIKAFYSYVGKEHIVEKKNPDWAVIVEVIKKTCMITITNEYQKYLKFNARMILATERKKQGISRIDGKKMAKEKKAKLEQEREERLKARKEGKGKRVQQE